MTEISQLLRLTDDFVLRSNHIRHEMLDDELIKFESSTAEDVCLTYCRLMNNTSFELASKLLKSIRDINSGPSKFVCSCSFPNAFMNSRNCSNEDVQLKFIEVVQKDSLQSLANGAHAQLIQQFCEFVCSNNPLIAEAAGQASLKYCLLYPALGVPALMNNIGLHSDDSTIVMRYACIIGSLLNPMKHISLLLNNRNSNSISNTITSNTNANIDEIPMLSPNDIFVILLANQAISFLIDICINTTDILVQIVSLEIISDFAGSVNSINYLFHENIFVWLLNKSSVLMDKSGDHMISCTCLTEMGNIFFKSLQCKTNEVLEQLITNEMVNSIIKVIEYCLDYESGLDEATRTAALNTLAGLCSLSTRCLHLVMNNKALVCTWVSLINRGPDTQAALLHSLATILTYHQRSIVTSTLEEHDLYQLIQQVGVYRLGVNTTMAYLVKVGSQPLLM